MRNIVIGTAGHIDHGKSTLVAALTGTDPDRLAEEKRRGITIDLGFAHWRSGDLNVAFVDVPGHERFVRNMLAGAGGIDAVLLVVAADESVMPQTREHFEICRLLRVPAGAIALTKSDLVDGEMLEIVRLEVRDLVAGSFLERAPVIPVSARTGAGLDELKKALAALAETVSRRSSGGVVRLPIDRIFTMKGFGTVVTGTLVSGDLALEQELEVLPGGTAVKVRGLQVHGESKERIGPGNRVALNLGGVEKADLARGQVLTTPGMLEPTRVIDVAIEVVPDARPLTHGARVRFHQGTSEVLGRIALAGPVSRSILEAAGGEVRGEVPPGGEAYARLRLEEPAVVTRGDRFILRAYSPPTTIAGGLVLDPFPPRTGIRRAGARERFEKLDPGAIGSAHVGGGKSEESADADLRAVLVAVAESGAAGLPVTALTTRLGIEPPRVTAIVDRLARSSGGAEQSDRGQVTVVEGRLVLTSMLADLGEKLVELLREHHRTEPLSEGVPREEVRERIFGRAGPGVFETVLSDLAANNRAGGRDRLALAGHRISLSGPEEKARDLIEARYREAGLKPPDPATLAREANLDSGVADRMLKLLIRQKVLVRVDTLVFHKDALEGLRRDVAAMKAAAGGAQATIDVATFKDRYGITRKYAIPLLELLDRERLTRRAGDVRVIV